MTELNTEYLERCLATLEKSYEMIQTTTPETIEYEMYRNSLVKGFEMTLEQSGKLLKKKLFPFFASKKALDILSFKDIFRTAHKHGLLSESAVLRWMQYRDNRNTTAHDYGVAFAEETLKLMQSFIPDVVYLIKVIQA